MPEDITQEDELKQTIASCLDLEKPKSLFLYAGAGTGKTRAVVKTMDMFRDRYGEQFRQSGQRVAVLTYTNAACDEIKRRTGFDPIFEVSTIHSFAWEQIRSYHKDISVWLRIHLSEEIGELHKKQAAGRSGTKAAAEREVQLGSKRRRLQRLDTVRHFTYNPKGENVGKNSLNHSEVIAILATFVADKPLMRQVLIRKYPVLLVDESQDTQKDLLDAFFTLQARHPSEFILFLFGDTMQRIYADGKVGLEQAVPDDWERPALIINHRCPKRIVRLLNSIRADADAQEQEPREDAPKGVVRLFLVNHTDDDSKAAVEAEAARRMAEIASDAGWTERQAVKVLTLEHHMAARRGGFDSFFEPLYGVSSFRTGLLDGSLNGVAFFAQQVLPLVKALQAKDGFAVAQVVRDHSPIVSADALRASESSLKEIRTAGCWVQSLFSLWENGADPSLIDVLERIAENGLFTVPEVFAPILFNTDPTREMENSADDKNPIVDAWRHALLAPFSQFESYVKYITDRSLFGTHQGVKGLQFPRVMVILDDKDARGFMFSYEKLFGAKSPTETDERNRHEGRETSIERTRRLFYVICSRAQESLAVVAYTKEADKVAGYLAGIGWFEDDEIVHL